MCKSIIYFILGFLFVPLTARAADISSSLTDTLVNATVYIETDLILSNSDWQALPEKLRAGQKRPQGVGSGSGWLVSPDGLIITNAHVVRASLKEVVQIGPKETREVHYVASGYKVVVRSGQEGEKTYVPRVVRIDEKADLAVLKINPPAPLTALHVHAEPSAAQGTPIFMAGFPGGKLPALAPFAQSIKGDAMAMAKNPKLSINSGTITALRENGSSQAYQLDVRANHGNSGGPIVNEQGEVVAVLNAGLTSMQSIDYAIPARYLHTVLQDNEYASATGEKSSPGGVGSAKMDAKSSTQTLASNSASPAPKAAPGESGAAAASAPAPAPARNSDGSQSYDAFKDSGSFKLSGGK